MGKARDREIKDTLDILKALRASPEESIAKARLIYRMQAKYDRLMRRPWYIQIFRGAGYLPEFGSHPGNEFMVIMMLMGAAAGLQGSYESGHALIGAIGGAILMTICLGPFWAIGAAGRANQYDRMVQKQEAENA